MEIRYIVLAVLLSLSACGGESDITADNTTAKINSPASSNLNAYLSEDKVCEVLPAEQLQSLFNATAEVEKKASSFRDSFSCSYTWARPDAAEREKNRVNAMIASASGDGPKLTLRDTTTEYQIAISLKKSQRSADSFVPRKLTEEQIKQQVDAAKKRSDERLTDEQKALAGDLANSIIESSLRKNNENQAVSNIGEAAFWSKLGTGSLEVLDGDVRLSISPTIADTKEEDMANAERIAAALLR